MTSILQIEGIKDKNAAKLKKAGVTSVEKLLDMGKTRKGRKELTEKSGCNDKDILHWVNRADMFRIKGVSTQYSELLEAAGVDTVVELSKRVPANLHAKMSEVNAAKKLVRQLPVLKQVEDWVAQAKKMDRVVEY
jgi:predicted flap endonuclease-1-like 5' DNA nuclease